MVYMQDWAYIIPVPLIDKDRVADAARSTGRQTDAAADKEEKTRKMEEGKRSKKEI